MISNVNNSMIGSAYANNTTASTQKKENTATATIDQKNSRIDQLKESIDAGKYKVDLSALSEKMADELL